MTIKSSLYTELQDFAQNSLSGKDYFGCIYGSYATSHFRPDSDIDVLFAADSFDQQDFEKIRSFVVSLHEQNGLTVDEEVPYQNKLLISYADINRAASLHAFPQDKCGKYTVPAISGDAESLASREVRSRLVLNALTTPHIFIAGNSTKYEELKGKCERALVKLAMGLAASEEPDGSGLKQVLLVGPGGEVGRNHLGYKRERAEVIAYLGGIIERNIDSHMR